MQALLDGRYWKLREQIRGVIARPEFEPPVGIPMQEYRRRVLEWAKTLAAEGLTAPGFPVEFGGEGDPGANVAAFETLAFGDLSLLVKVGVQFGLCGGAVHQLGTRRHHERYLQAIATLELPGAFAMTETGHGSDVQHLETTATYDPETQEFVIHTPVEQARNDYIGNATRDGRMAVVFAQLIVDGERHGVHCLVVPLRDEKGKTLPGIRIEDCGEKLGLEGVDNGRIWFDQVRVPRENLLNRYADVDEEGRYTSPIENANRRFFTMLGTLIQGRVSVGGASITASKLALTTAIRYGLVRRQFGAPGGDSEALLMDYRAHQRRLMPLLAKTYALHFAQETLVAELHRVFTQDAPDRERRVLEGLAAGVKAIATWHATRTIQTCREACGGAGYLTENRFADLKADTDVFTTFEGDNTVLLQLVAKGLLRITRSASATSASSRWCASWARRCSTRWWSARSPASSWAPCSARCRATRRSRPSRSATSTSTSSAAARSTCSAASHAGSSAGSTTGRTRSRSSTSARTTCSRRPARTWTGSFSSRSRRP